MKVSSLRPGMQVLCGGRLMTFVSRDKYSRPRLNWFVCEDYKGLNGSDDTGLTCMDDHDFRANCQPVKEVS